MRETEKYTEKWVRREWLEDPVCKRKVPAIVLGSQDGMNLTLLPDRALDIYALFFRGRRVSYLDHRAGLAPENFVENGVEGFSVNFFGGFLTTCGLLNAGRPCRENGRAFGLHGCISNTACTRTKIYEDASMVRVCALVEENHPQGERLRMERVITLLKRTPYLEIHDIVTNAGKLATPVMMMYHINFGEPFLSEKLQVSADFTYVEERDTKRCSTPDEVLAMAKRGSAQRETVYYTQTDLQKGVSLCDPVSGVRIHLRTEGEWLKWMGFWKSFTKKTFALGVEPCFCPGVGRVEAARRKVLPALRPGEQCENRICIDLKAGFSDMFDEEGIQ